MFELEKGLAITMYVRCSKCHFAEKHVASGLGPWSCPECGSHTIDLSYGNGVPEWWRGAGKPAKADIVVADADLNGISMTSEHERVGSQQLLDCAHCGSSARFSSFSGRPVIFCDGCLSMMGGEEYDGTYLQLKTDWNRRPAMVIENATFGPPKKQARNVRMQIERVLVVGICGMLGTALLLWAFMPLLRGILK